METMVPRVELLKSQADYTAAHDDAESRGKSLKSALEKLSQTKDALKRCTEEIDALKAALDRMVPRSDLLDAKAGEKRAKDDLEAMSRQAFLWEEKVKEMRDELKQLKDDKDSLNAMLADMAPKNELTVSRKDAKTARDSADSLQKQLKDSRDLCTKLQQDVIDLKTEMHALKILLGESVPKAELIAAKSEAMMKGELAGI